MQPLYLKEKSDEFEKVLGTGKEFEEERRGRNNANIELMHNIIKNKNINNSP